MSYERPYGLWAIMLVEAALITVFFSTGLWQQSRMNIDAPSYYAYLPAAIIHHDLQLNFVDENPSFYKDKLWYYKTQDGKKVIHHPIGVSLALLPFFMAGHVAAKISGDPQDGYSMSYQNAVSIGVLIYLAAGLYFLRRMLLQFFSEKITAVTICAIVLGTNLFWYSSFDGIMSHSISFSFTCICLCLFFRWLDTGSAKHFLLFSFVFGFIVLIRPLSVLLVVYFLLYGIISKGSIRYFFRQLNPRIVLPGAALFLSLFFLQMLYWKDITGKWIYDAYPDQYFIFSSPLIIPFLFGFNKGFFVYTPIMLFSIAGLINLFRNHKPFFFSTLVVICIVVYIYSSWWVWNYGISWGMRPMIDFYPLLGFPMAAAFSAIASRGKLFSATAYLLISVFIVFNLFQTWQYKNGLLHFDSMTRKAYFTGLFQTSASWEWRDELQPYDFERRLHGLPQIKYDKDFLIRLSPADFVSIRGFNFKLCTVDVHKFNSVMVSGQEVNAGTAFNFICLGGDTIAIKDFNSRYVSVQPQMSNALLAIKDQIGFTEKFILAQLEEDGNKITLKALNGKYVSVIPEWNSALCASSEVISRACIFRVFALDKK